MDQLDIPKNMALSTPDTRQEVVSIIGGLGDMFCCRGDIAKCNPNNALLENNFFSFPLYCPTYTGFFVTVLHNDDLWLFNAKYLNHGSIDTWTGSLFAVCAGGGVGGCPVLCRIFSSIPGLFLLNASSTVKKCFGFVKWEHWFNA